MIKKSTGKKVMCSSTITLLTLPEVCLIQSSTSSKSIEHFSIFCNSSNSYSSLDKRETLDPRPKIA
jgi:hypothetical protein